MKKHTIAFAAGTAITTLALAGSAAATGSAYKVKVGTATSGAHPITATSGSAHVFTLPSATLSCASAATPSSPTSSTSAGSAIVNLLTIAYVNYSDCTNSLFPYRLTVVTGSWLLHGTSSASTGSTDIIRGHVDDYLARVYNVANPALCDFSIKGLARSSYNEATKRLTINETGGSTGQLKVVGPVKGCQGQIAVGDVVKYSGTLDVASPDGTIAIG